MIGGGSVRHFATGVGLSRRVSGCMGTKLSFGVDHGGCSGMPLKGNRGRGSNVVATTITFGPAIPIESRGKGCSAGPRVPRLPGPISLLRVGSGAMGRQLLNSTCVRIRPVGKLGLGTGLNVSQGCRGQGACLPGAARCKTTIGNRTCLTRRSGGSCLVSLATGCRGVFNRRDFGILFNCSCRGFGARKVDTNGRSFVGSSFLCGGLKTKGCDQPPMNSCTSMDDLDSCFKHFGCS